MIHLHTLKTLLLPILVLLLVPVSAEAEQKSIDLSLAEAVETALLQNLGLKLSREDVLQAEGAALAAEGTFDYQLTGEVGATGSNETPVTTVGSTKENTAAWNAENTPLFHAGQSRAKAVAQPTGRRTPSVGTRRFRRGSSAGTRAPPPGACG